MNYNSIEDIISDVTHATVIINNEGHDEDAVAVDGVDWLTFNNAAVAQIYCSGNSWLGFGSNSEHLRVNRRDAKMYNLWREEGTLYGYYHFIRIRWNGYTYYGTTGDDYRITFDVVLLDTGDIYLHMVDIPTSYNDGTNELSVGTTYSYTYSSESPNVSFYKQEDGSFIVANEEIQIQPPFDRKYLIKDSKTGNLYNITDRALVRIPISEVTATVFRQYGMDEISDSALLLGIHKPVILYWQDSDMELPEKKVVVKAVPPEQNITTEIDLSDESITGITGVNVEVSGEPVFSCSFDDGSTWSVHNGTDWVTIADGAAGMDADTLKAITSEQWNAATADGSFFVFRITLTSAEDAVSSVVFNFMN